MSCELDSSTATDPTEAQPCPGCGATHGAQPQPAPPKVQAWTCTACGLHCAVTVVNAHLSRQPPSPARNDIARPILGLLPPEQRTAAALRTEVAPRSGKEHTMTVTVCFPIDQVVQFDAMATVDTTVWWCRICGQEATARTTPQATSDAVAHLGSDHGGVGNCR